MCYQLSRVAILSDTHLPSRAERISNWVRAEVRAADHVIHAGDFDSPVALERVEALADGELVAVRGNMDPHRVSLPEITTIHIHGQPLVVTHGTGPPDGYETCVSDGPGVDGRL